MARSERWPRMWGVFVDGSVIGVRRTKAEAERLLRMVASNSNTMVHLEGPYVLQKGRSR